MITKLIKSVLALLIVGILGGLTYNTVTVEVPVLNDAVNTQEFIKADNISDKRVFVWDTNDQTVYRGEDLVGKVALIDIPADTALTHTAIEERVGNEVISTDENVNKVIVPIKVDSSKVPADLQKNDLVNVIAYFPAATVEGESAFAVGFNVVGSVSNISYDTATGLINRVDVLMDKEISVEVSASISMGEIYIIRNIENNDIQLQGTTARDIFLNNYHIEVHEGSTELVEEEVAPQPEVQEQPQVEEGGE